MFKEKNLSKVWLMIDTSLEIHHFALWQETLLWKLEMPMKESMEKAVEQLALKLDSFDVSGIMLAMGPGSYTGLRWGYSLACGLATSLKVPVISFSSFLAYSSEGESSVILFDARAGGLYAGLIDENAHFQHLWRWNKSLQENGFENGPFEFMKFKWKSPESELLAPQLQGDWPILDHSLWNPKRWIDAYEAGACAQDSFPFRNIRLEYLKQDHEVPSVRAS
jgi:hypothetical protein